jgi:hypothetical protein
MGDLPCNPFEYDGPDYYSLFFLTLGRICPQQTRGYDEIVNEGTCNNFYNLGEGMLQPDSLTYNGTASYEYDIVKINDIRYNPWASDDILRLAFHGDITGAVMINGEGFCATSAPFEIEFDGPESPLVLQDIVDAETATGHDVSCAIVAIQQDVHEFRICQEPFFLAGLCECARWTDWTDTDASLFAD